MGSKLLRAGATIVTPATLLAWHRRLIAQQYDGRGQRGRGRPRKSQESEDLVVRRAEENRRWGERRIPGALSNLGQAVGRGTLAEMVARHGMEPAPEREQNTSWKEFLRPPWDWIVAADFFPIEAWTPPGWQRVLVRCWRERSTRKVEMAGLAPRPKGWWRNQIGRKLTDGGTGC